MLCSRPEGTWSFQKCHHSFLWSNAPVNSSKTSCCIVLKNSKVQRAAQTKRPRLMTSQIKMMISWCRSQNLICFSRKMNSSCSQVTKILHAKVATPTNHSVTKRAPKKQTIRTQAASAAKLSLKSGSVPKRQPCNAIRHSWPTSKHPFSKRKRESPGSIPTWIDSHRNSSATRWLSSSRTITCTSKGWSTTQTSNCSLCVTSQPWTSPSWPPLSKTVARWTSTVMTTTTRKKSRAPISTTCQMLVSTTDWSLRWLYSRHSNHFKWCHKADWLRSHCD